MEVVFTRNGFTINRRFIADNNYKQWVKKLRGFKYWNQINKLFGVKGIKAISCRPEDYYLKDTPLPWHLKILISRALFRKTPLPPGTKFSAIFRHVGDFAYYVISSSNKGFIPPPPKFERFRGKTERKELGALDPSQQRGIADTVIALIQKLEKLNQNGVKEFLDDFTVTVGLTNLRVVKQGTRWRSGVTLDAIENKEYHRYLIPIGSEDGPSLLIVSHPFAEAFEKLADMWHSPGIDSFIIIAPPGSGKEELVNAVAAGLRRKVTKVALGSQSGEVIEAKLFGTTLNRGLFSNYHERAAKRQHKKTAKRQDNIIFFDEVDKCSREARSILLRAVESRDYLNGRDGKVHQLRRDLIFGFAGSMEWEMMRQLEPQDFWTRVKHKVIMAHPFARSSENDTSYDLNKTLTYYFAMFWKRAVDKAKEDSAASDYEKELLGELGEWKYVENFAKAFAKILAQDFVPNVSVRIVRSMTDRVFTHVFQEALKFSGPDISKVVNVYRKKIPQLIRELW